MTGSRSERRMFLAELKRRKVYHVAVVYAAVAFVVVEGADLVFPALLLPSWGYTLLVVFAILGFPIALVLAWAFEVTPEGVRRTAAPAVPVKSQTAEPLPSGATDVAGKSIAVLPFANVSADPENEYFSDGLTEEIIGTLTRIKNLRVAGRTSSYVFKGEPLDVGEIGAKLKVATVLEGSVRRTGDRLRITAQLIDVSNGYQLWSQRGIPNQSTDSAKKGGVMHRARPVAVEAND